VKTVVASSFAKINLGLRVLGRRPDGYHELRTTLQSVDLADEIRVDEAAILSLQVYGDFIVPADESNLVLKAARALAERFSGMGARIRLTKRIPPGSGLGGGSSNAAMTLRALERLWGIEVDPGLMHALASRLGMDVPYFLHGGTCLALGRGDEVFGLPDAPERDVVVLWPGVPLATREVYEGLPESLTRTRNLSSMKGFVPVAPSRGMVDQGVAVASIRADQGEPPPEVENDLEETAFAKIPGLRRLKERLLSEGALAAAMTGSGSAIYGLFAPRRGGRARLEKLAAAMVKAGGAGFVCGTLTREEYRRRLWQPSRT
jgi:4-diphosphocytidyl-2-C-methyl-D-erythritol kinase